MQVLLSLGRFDLKVELSLTGFHLLNQYKMHIIYTSIHLQPFIRLQAIIVQIYLQTGSTCHIFVTLCQKHIHSSATLSVHALITWNSLSNIVNFEVFYKLP